MGDEIYDLTDADVKGDFDNVGDRITIDEILEKEIVIYEYSLKPSLFHNGDYATVLVDLYEDDGLTDKRVLFTSSKVLIEQLEKFKAKMPYKTMINKKHGDKWVYYTMGINKRGLRVEGSQKRL